jgi:threonine/homoserine/homoserine lactone efflux protein
MVIRSSVHGGWRAGIATTAGNEIRCNGMALLSVLGISALVAASEVAFVALQIVGAGVLMWLGIRSWRGSHVASLRPARRPLRDGLITALASPKLAVFFVALLQQFCEQDVDVLPATLLMAALLVAFDFVWYTTLA